MKQVFVGELKEGNWYFLYNNIDDCPYKEMFLCRYKNNDQQGYHFEESKLRMASMVWSSGAEFEKENQTACLFHNRENPYLVLYELSEDEVGLHVVAEEV